MAASGGSGSTQPMLIRTPNRRSMNQRPTLVLVKAAMTRPTGLGDIRQRAGALTATTPAIGAAGGDDDAWVTQAAGANTAMAPLGTPPSTPHWPPSAAPAAAAATAMRS